MKSVMNLAACIVVFLSIGQVPVFAQFEGIVESKNLTVDETDKPQEFSMVMWVGSGKMRVRNSAIGSAPPSTIIYRNDKGVFWVIDEQAKTYIEVLLNPEEGEQQKMPGIGEENRSAVKKTGKTRSILGFQCEQYIVKRPGELTEIWGTKQLAGLVTALTALLGAAQAEASDSWSDELTKMGVFPLSATTRIDGRLVESQEVTKIEKSSLAPELFELPAGFSRENVSGDMRPEKKE